MQRLHHAFYQATYWQPLALEVPQKYALIEEEPWKHEGAKDEITEALEPEMVREVLDVVLALAREGRTMVIVTHEMQFAKAVADRMIFLECGKIVEEGNPKEFFENPIFILSTPVSKSL